MKLLSRSTAPVATDCWTSRNLLEDWYTWLLLKAVTIQIFSRTSQCSIDLFKSPWSMQMALLELLYHVFERSEASRYCAGSVSHGRANNSRVGKWAVQDRSLAWLFSAFDWHLSLAWPLSADLSIWFVKVVSFIFICGFLHERFHHLWGKTAAWKNYHRFRER